MKNLAFVLFLVITFSACQKEGTLTPLPPDETNNNNGNGNDNDDDDNDNETSTGYYFSAKINGETVRYDDNNINLGYGVYHYQSSLGEEDFDMYEGTTISKGAPSDTSAVEVSLLKYFNHEPSLEERWAIFASGSHGYGLAQSSSATTNGGTIVYFDKNGKYWDSELGSQTGSTFNVTEVIENENHLYGKIVTAEFSCKLYDEEGNSIQVTEGIIRGPVYGQ